MKIIHASGVQQMYTNRLVICTCFGVEFKDITGSFVYWWYW